MSPRDVEYMRLALRLAERGRGACSPNPMVGAVVASADGTIVGMGFHERAGEPHAEVHALRRAGAHARGGTLYSTLEPCAHVGRTGPCCIAVAEAGVARVVIAGQDPNPLVAGKGVAYLRAHGVEVETGVLRAEAERLNVAFLTSMRKGRPWVVLKVALSADAAVARRRGERTALTSAQASRLVHRFRAEVDAIGVGSQTVLDDDPWLTVRGVYRERPLLRVVFDGRLRTPPTAALFRTREQGPILVFTTPAACQLARARVEALREVGAEIVVGDPHDLVAAMRDLAHREIRSLVLEGGPSLQRSAWRARVVDAVQAFITPTVLGTERVAWAMPPDFSLAALFAQRVIPLGPDVLLEGECSRA